MSIFTSSTCLCTRSQHKRQENKIGQEVKLSLIRDDEIVYIENPKEPTEKFHDLISEFSKGTEHKVSIQKAAV